MLKILEYNGIMLYYIEYLSTLSPALLGYITRLKYIQKSQT